MAAFATPATPPPPPLPAAAEVPPKRGKGKILVAAAVAVAVMVVGGAALAATISREGGDAVETSSGAPDTTTEAEPVAPSGDFLVDFEVTDVIDPGDERVGEEKQLGTTFTRRWRLMPFCEQASCDLEITRETRSLTAPELRTDTWTATDGDYRFSSTEERVCFDSETGERLPDQVLTSTEEVVLTVTGRRPDGSPNAFEVTSTHIVDANAAAEANDCNGATVVEIGQGRSTDTRELRGPRRIPAAGRLLTIPQTRPVE